MTGADLFQATRVILRDTGYGTYSDGRMYAPDEIGTQLTIARADAVKYLYSVFAIIGTSQNYSAYTAQMQGSGLPPSRARVTLSKLLHTTGLAASPQTAPDDFWKIECGIDNNGKYIHPEPPVLGKAMATNAYQTSLYALGGSLYGTLCTVYYWSLPQTTITDTGMNLAAGSYGLPDGFYHAVKYLAAANLVKKERSDSEDRYKFLMQMFMRRLSTLG